MKKLLLTAAAVLATLNMYAQGTAQGIVNFATVGVTDDRRIWVNTTGNVMEGSKAAAGYVVALYWGPAGSVTDAGFTQIGPAALFLTTATTSGTFNGGGRTITYPGTVGGAVLSLQARAWNTAGGATWEEALLNPQGQVGKGRPFDMDTKDPAIPTEQPPTVGQNAGWNGFAITPVPEPSAIALGLLGVGTLLMLRRRK